MTDATSPILIITGMHRSGTSLTASLLQSAGVDIGSKLMAPSEGNIKGHFEDLEVVEFHENVLEANHLSPEGWVTLKTIPEIPEDLLPKAQQIINYKRQITGITGWKDPRGTLFLNFWQSQLPEAKFILLYRAPWEVMDSLYRRGDSIFQDSPYLALAFWMSYNTAILNFYKRYPQQSCLFNIENIRKDPRILSKAISEKFSLFLDPEDSIYDPSIFHPQSEESSRPFLIKDFFPEAISMYQELEDCSDSSNQEDRRLFTKEISQKNFDKQWLLNDWLAIRATQRRLFQTQSQLHITEQREIETKQALAETQKALSKTTEALHHSQNQLAKTKADLYHCQNQLTQEKVALQHSQEELAQTQTHVTHLQTMIEAMESSKFWKLRRVWMKVKQKLTFQ
ncbi:MAG: chromosome partitioning protein ParA [Halothece sp. Uz-M2-17]|nr:chromosome partitioning protein ParA [Halothece sp. Uz-M2-17]